MTALMASLQITWVKPHSMQGSQLILHGPSASRIRPQTSQQTARLSSIPSAALCLGLVAVGQDPPQLFHLNSSQGICRPSSCPTAARFFPLSPSP